MVNVNQTVRVREGAFDGFAGKVTSLNAATGTAVVNLLIFGRTTPVEVSLEGLEPTDTPDASAGSIGGTQDPTAILDEE